MKVTDFRLSCIWVEALPELLGAQDLGLLGGLVRSDRYAKLFNAVLADDNNPLVTVPWHHQPDEKYPFRNSYWADYILREFRDHPKASPGDRAWRAVVPFRRKVPPARIQRSERCFLEGWYYPHGIALTVTAWFRGEFDAIRLKVAADEFLRGTLGVTWPDGRVVQIGLNTLAGQSLDMLRREAFGEIQAGYRPEPMRILTIVRAKHGTENIDQTELEVALRNAVISAAGGDPNSKTAPVRNIYAFSRARVIWRSDRAFGESREIHTLGCLHRNIVMATLQVMSLLRGAEVLAAAAEDQGRLSPRIEPYARRLAGIIGRIHGGKETYFQECLRDQIAAANEKGRLDGLRQVVEMEPLTSGPQPASGHPT